MAFGISVGSIYYYLGGFDGVIDEVCDDVFVDWVVGFVVVLRCVGLFVVYAVDGCWWWVYLGLGELIY